MNFLISEDLTRENLILETAKCLKEIFKNTQKADALHKEILEIDLSLNAYVEESRKNLEGLRLDIANQATSSQEVVTALSDKSDDAILEWFGRTIKNKKKVAAFLKYDMQCSHHDFTTIESIEKVELRSNRLQRNNDAELTSPLYSPEIVKGAKMRKLFASPGSPEWAEGCKPADEFEIENKINKNDFNISNDELESQCNGRKRLYSEDDSEIHSKGDCMGPRVKRKCVHDAAVTPSNEVGQGDCCRPSTSGTDSTKPHDTLNAEVVKLGVECNGYIEFMRSKYSLGTDTMKWERKCKMQISYSEDSLNVGEYIIWLIRYTDETKCRRNLLAAFNEIAKKELKDI